MGSDPDALRAKERLRAQLFEEVPQKIGRYVIEGELGSGAMGKVLRAHDPKLKRPVAVKVLLAGMVTAEMTDRFLREAQALARLTHPNVVQVFEVGQYEGERFIAMELIDGGTLQQWLAARDRGIDEIIDLFVELAGGLQAAHDAGILHRDFKPANVLVGSDGRARITDFGLAAGERSGDAPLVPDEISSADRLSGTLTHDGHVVGTPAYMSPEQFSAQTLDARADQFAFCVTLFEALYGARPFRARSVPELSRVVTEGRLQRPEGVDVPARIEAVLLRGLSAQRSRRYRSMTALAKALRASKRGASPGLAGLAAVGGIAAVALIALAIWPSDACGQASALVDETWGREAKAAVTDGLARSGVVAPQERAAWVNAKLGAFFDRWANVRDESCRAADEERRRDAVFACLRRQRTAAGAAIDLLRTGETEEVKGGLFAVARLDDPQECAREGTIAPAPEIADEVARVRAELERVLSVALVRRSAAVVRAAADIVEQAEALGYGPLLAEALLLKATAATETSAKLQSETLLERAHALASEADDARLQLRAAAALVETVGITGRRFDDAERWLRMARAVASRAPQEAWRADMAEARLRRVQHRVDEAVALDREALAKAESVLGKGHIYVARARVNLAMDLASSQRREEAQTQLDLVLGELEPALGRDHPLLADAYYAQAQLRRAAGDLDGAVESIRASAEVFGAITGELNLLRADRLQALGAITAESGRHAEACEHFERVLDYYEHALPADDPRTGLVLGNLALAYRYLGKHAEARAYAERAVIVSESGQGDTAPLAAALSLLADVLFAAGEYEVAVERSRRALALEGYPPGRRIALRQTLAVSLGELGRYDEAIAELGLAAESARELYGAAPDTAALLSNQGYFMAKVGRLREGAKVGREAVTMIEDTLGPGHYKLSRALHIQVYLESEQGNLEEAEVLARRVLELRKDAGRDPLELAAAHFSLAEVLHKAKVSPDEVLEHARSARTIYANGNAPDDLAEVDAFLEERSASRTAPAKTSRR